MSDNKQGTKIDGNLALLKDNFYLGAEALEVARSTKNAALLFEKARLLMSIMITQGGNIANIEKILKKLDYGIYW